MKHFKEWILNLHPLTYLIISTALIISDILIYNIVISLIYFGVLVLFAFFIGKGRLYLSKIFKSMFVLILLIFLLQSIMYQGNSQILFKWGLLSIKKEGVIHASKLATTLIAFSGTFFLMFLLTDARRLIGSLEEKGLHPKIAYVLLSTFQIIPQMSKKSKVIMDAQRSRGVETEGNLLIRTRALIPMLIPLVLSSIVETEERALMLESRAFSYQVKKTHLTVIKDTKQDRLLRKFSLVFMIFVVVGRVAFWIV